MEIAVTVSEDVDDDGVGDDNSLSVDEEDDSSFGIHDTNFSFVVSVS